MDEKTWDVIVVGSGPGGCVAAKRCAQGGLKTLLLEKRRLPRDKVCTGMIMGPWAKNITEQEFGEIPLHILSEPSYLKGIMLHIAGAELITIPNLMPIGWRRDIDYWMCQKAMEAGAEVKDRVKVTQVRLSDTGYEVEVQKGKERDKFYARFVIGANGADSTIRKFISPDLHTRYRPAYRECYEGELSIEKDHFHWFHPMASPSPRFDVIHKGRFFLIEGGGIKILASEIKRILKDYGFDPNSKPIWRDGCLIPVIHDDLLKGLFRPAKDNALLVGDAAGFLLPFTGEGIGAALESGMLAAEAILKALRLGMKADTIYLSEAQVIIETIQRLRLMAQEMGDTATKGGEAFSKSFGKLIEETLKECTV